MLDENQAAASDTITRRSLMLATGAALSAGFAMPQAVAPTPPPSRSTLWLCEDGFRNTTQDGQKGFQLRVRLNPYRSEPLCCVEEFQVAVDGEQFDPKSMILTLNHYSYRVADLTTRWSRWQDVPWWFILDRAELFIPREQGLSQGEHQIVASINVRGPFGTGGRGRGRHLTPTTKQLALETD
jgi:hypothetical protein